MNEDENILVPFIEVVNPLGLDEAQYEIIEQMAACNFPVRHIAVYLDLDVDVFVEEYNDTSSEVYQRYQKGVLQSSFEINMKLDSAARNGNITSMQQFEKHKKSVRAENLKEKFFG